MYVRILIGLLTTNMCLGPSLYLGGLSSQLPHPCDPVFHPPSWVMDFLLISAQPAREARGSLSVNTRLVKTPSWPPLEPLLICSSRLSGQKSIEEVRMKSQLIPSSCLFRQRAPGLAGWLSQHQEDIFILDRG